MLSLPFRERPGRTLGIDEHGNRIDCLYFSKPVSRAAVVTQWSRHCPAVYICVVVGGLVYLDSDRQRVVKCLEEGVFSPKVFRGIICSCTGAGKQWMKVISAEGAVVEIVFKGTFFFRT